MPKIKCEMCENCRYHKKAFNGATLCLCLRYHPVNLGGYFDYPVVSKAGWCGEYKEGVGINE